MGSRILRTLLTVAGASTLWLFLAHNPSSAASPESAQIVIRDFMFQPMSLTVKAGSTVTWTNADDEPHAVVSDANVFRSGAIDTNETFSFKFETPGTYHFSCSLHPRMVGTVVVQ